MECPVCKKDDLIQKVSAVYYNGEATGNFSGPVGTVSYSDGNLGTGGGFVAGRIHTISNLAARCAPPEKPELKNSPIMIIIGLLVLTIWFCASVQSLNDFQVLQNQYLGLLPPLLGIFLIIVGIIRIVEANKEYPELRRRYDEEIRIWRKLYYCHRDGILFNSENGDYWES